MIRIERRMPRGDDGVAMMTVMLVGALMMALALIVSDVSLSNLKNAGRDRVAVSAFGAAEAGVQEAVAHLRVKGVSELGAFGDPANPKVLQFGDGRQAKVWVEVKSVLKPPIEKTGRYVIHSEGTSGAGPGVRRIAQEVIAEHFLYPMGVYADHIASNGTPTTYQQSVFSENCIFGREKMVFSGNDLYYGGKAAAHSAKFISEGSGSCSKDNDKNIHVKVTKVGSTTTRERIHCPVTVSQYHDKDSWGGDLSSTACAPLTSSYLDLDLMKANYGGRLPAEVLQALRQKAIDQGNHWTSNTGWAAPDPTKHPDAVLYFEVGANVTVAIQNELNAYGVDATTCTPKRSIIIIVDNATVGSGGLQLQSGANLSGGVFIPNGNLDYRGSTTFTGPLNSRTISNWAGSAKSQLTQCFLDNLPGGLLDVKLGSFREVDR